MLCGKLVQGLAAVHAWPPSFRLPAVMDMSMGSQWLIEPAANAAGKSYVPGTLQLRASPFADIDKIRNCEPAVLAQAPSARAAFGFSKNEIGRPVAMARRPTKPAPA